MSDVVLINNEIGLNNILVPTNVQSATLETKTNEIIYVPIADKYKFGVVREGDGINIKNGIVSLDKSVVESMIDDNTWISYGFYQNLTEEQKSVARHNIGAGTGSGESVDLSNYVTLNTTQSITGNKIINAEFEVNSILDDYSKTSHLVVSSNMIQLMNQDLNGDGGSVIITPQGGVQVDVSGNSVFTYNGKRVATTDDIPSGTGTSVEIVWWEE